MAAGSYTVISPGSTSGSVNVGQGGALAPWYIDSNGGMVNTGTGSLAANYLELGPTTTTGVKLANSQAGTVRAVTGDGSANAIWMGAFRVAALDGTIQMTDATSAGAAGLKFYYDGSATAANVYVQAFRQRYVTASKAANYTVVIGDSGTVFDNAGATGTVVFTLPAATLGQEYTFCTAVAQIVTVTPNSSSDTIVLGSKAAGASITSTAAKGGYLTLCCTSANTWAILGVSSSPAWS